MIERNPHASQPDIANIKQEHAPEERVDRALDRPSRVLHLARGDGHPVS